MSNYESHRDVPAYRPEMYRRARLPRRNVYRSIDAFVGPSTEVAVVTGFATVVVPAPPSNPTYAELIEGARGTADDELTA